MTAFIGLKAIDKGIATFTTNAAKLNDLGHNLAMAILTHAAPIDEGGLGHGDCTRAIALVYAMPASMRRTMMIAWFAQFSPITVKLADKKSPDKCEFNKGKNAAKWDLKGAAETPFFKLAEEQPEDKEYDLAALIKMVQAIGKRIGKKIEEGKVPANDIDKARVLLGKVEAIAA